jgi:hypothetical protein
MSLDKDNISEEKSFPQFYLFNKFKRNSLFPIFIHQKTKSGGSEEHYQAVNCRRNTHHTVSNYT